MRRFGGSYRHVKLPQSKKVKTHSGKPTDPWPGIPTGVKLGGVIRKPRARNYGYVAPQNRSHNYK